ncbi:hypothetical protein OKW21_000262 [Catalinimonas alkaloidigena]|nr:hypothetical protein [Catalinimonas alkaloidigena]
MKNLGETDIPNEVKFSYEFPETTIKKLNK